MAEMQYKAKEMQEKMEKHPCVMVCRGIGVLTLLAVTLAFFLYTNPWVNPDLKGLAEQKQALWDAHPDPSLLTEEELEEFYW